MGFFRWLSDFGIGRVPVGSIVGIIIFLLLAVAVGAAYWFVFDLFPRYWDKIVIAFGLLYAYGVYSQAQERKKNDQTPIR